MRLNRSAPALWRADRRRLALSLAALTLLGTACSGVEERIAFTSTRDGNQEIYTARPNGDAPIRLTSTMTVDESWPAWSPNRRHVAYVSAASEGANLWVSDSDGEAELVATGLLPPSTPSTRPFAWSPDGARIAYVADLDGQPDVYVVDITTLQRLRLTNYPGAKELGNWSPDGQWIVYATLDGDRQGLHRQNPQGVNEIQITDQADFSPVWAPRGDQIAFLSRRDNAGLDIYVTDIDGSSVLNLTETAWDDYDFDWSPDARRIAFVSERDGNREIYVISIDRQELHRLTHNTVEDVNPRWSPDGRRIVFASRSDGDFDLFTMNRDGSDQRRITATDHDETLPAW